MCVSSKILKSIRIEVGLPNIVGNMDKGFDSIKSRTATLGAFQRTHVSHSYGGSGSGASGYYLGFNASLSNSTYGNSETVTPLSQSTLYILKY